MTLQPARTRPASLPQLNSLPPISRLLVQCALGLARWQSRKRSRLALSRLDDRLLQDIGMRPETRTSEVGKPFWRE